MKPHSPTFAPHMLHAKAASCMSQVPGAMLSVKPLSVRLLFATVASVAASLLAGGLEI